jgi:hypothetical protein
MGWTVLGNFLLTVHDYISICLGFGIMLKLGLVGVLFYLGVETKEFIFLLQSVAEEQSENGCR